jgi:hypothetical protein
VMRGSCPTRFEPSQVPAQPHKAMLDAEASSAKPRSSMSLIRAQPHSGLVLYEHEDGAFREFRETRGGAPRAAQEIVRDS